MAANRRQIPAPERVEQQREATAVEQARAARPKRTIKNVPRAQQWTAANTVAFETTQGVKRLVLKVGLRPAGVSRTDDELTEDCLRVLGSRYLHFSNGLYVSAEPAVTAWLRHRIKAGVATSYRERVAQPTAAIVGDETVMFSPTGERLMTYEQFMAHQQRMAPAADHPPAPDIDAPTADADATPNGGVDTFALARPDEDAARRERRAASRVGADPGTAQKGTATA